MIARPQTIAPADLELVVSSRRRRPRLRGWLLFTVLVVVAFLALIYSRVTLDQSAFVIEDLERQMAEEETLYWDLRLEVARLESPERIVRAAEGLGLVYPEARTTVTAHGVTEGPTAGGERWFELKALLSAQP